MSKAKGGSANQAVLEYLKRQNRPYSAVDIFTNLHGELGKTAVVKSLEWLADRDQVREKTYGKQKVYYVNQQRTEGAEQTPTEQLDGQMGRLTSELKELRGRVKGAEAGLSALKSAATDRQLRQKLAQTQADNRETAERLERLRSDGRSLPAGARERALADNRTALKEWKRRKRMACDVLEAVLEGYPKSKKALLEETGVETDEEARVRFPDTPL